MVNIPLAGSDYQRRVAKAPELDLRNRFAERNPALSSDPVAVISRPALRKFAEVGTGPVRKVFSQPGTFDEALFAVSGTNLFIVDRAGVPTDLGQLSADALGDVSMAATAPIQGSVPAYLWIAEGGILWCYTDDGFATGQLEASGAIANNDTISIDGTYYQWTNGDVNAGAPDGSSGNPWLVALGVDNVTSLTSMFHAINGSGTVGTDYSDDLVPNSSVRANAVSGNNLFVVALDPGSAGNGIAVAETGANLAWAGGGTLTGGGTSQLRQVAVPDDLGAISVAVINSYVIVVPVQEDDIKGRFYWIEPGESYIDYLNFSTAERSPDGLHQVVVFGDFFWLMGQTTTEPWVTTGDPDAPMQRFQGILFDRGSWEGTAMRLKDSLLVVDEDGGVFLIKNGQQRLTENRPDIEERIRKAIALQKLL